MWTFKDYTGSLGRSLPSSVLFVWYEASHLALSHAPYDGSHSNPEIAESSDQGLKSLKLGAFFCKVLQVIRYGCSNSASKSRSRESGKSGKWVLQETQVSSLGWRWVVQCCGAAVLRKETARRLFTPLPGPVRSMAVTITSPGQSQGEYTFKEWKL